MPLKSQLSRGLRILSLDGGDARCMSQLLILEELMYRVEQVVGKPVKPCEYFDLIIGADSGGFIAALLGIVGMTADEALEAFYNIYQETLLDESHTPETRTTALKDALTKTFKGYKHLDGANMEDAGVPEMCKVALCYASTADMSQYRLFRNYPSSKEPTLSTSVIDAISATWVNPELMNSIAIGPTNSQEQLCSASNGFNNPAQVAIEEAYQVFGGDTALSCLLSLGSGRQGLASLVNPSEKTAADIIVQDCEQVAEDLAQRIGQSGVYFRFSVDQGFSEVGDFTGEFGSITSFTAAYLGRKVTSNLLDQCINASERGVPATLAQLYYMRGYEACSFHGLPPVSPFFVAREQPMKTVEEAFFAEVEQSQRMTVISGLGGSGKTQLAIYFARQYERSFKHVLFIDASSKQSLENDMVLRVRSFGQKYHPKDVQEAMTILATPDEAITKDWLIIFDNADDPSVEVSLYFPECHHGNILVTTRNELTGTLVPARFHLKLDVMSSEEATNALLSSIFSSNSAGPMIVNSTGANNSTAPTNRDREVASAIVKELGYLPIAVVQAGCYIRQKQCFFTYLEQLKEKRVYLLSRPTPAHRDKIKYGLSVYAAFDITSEALSERALGLLGVLSYCHFSGFPLPLFAIAQSDLYFEYLDLLDRDKEETEQTISLLRKILGLNGKNETIDDLMDELQRFSFVSLVSIHTTTTLRFHPLALLWAQDRLSMEDQSKHRAAAIRLIACGTSSDHRSLFEHLLPHAEALCTNIQFVHVNDRAGFAHIFLRTGKADTTLHMYKDIHRLVESKHGKMHIRTARAKAYMGGAYATGGDHEKHIELSREVAKIREHLLGADHLETADAWADLGIALENEGKYKEAEDLMRKALRVAEHHYGQDHKLTARYMTNVAVVLQLQKRHLEAVTLYEGAVSIRTKVFGSSHPLTAESRARLARCYQTHKALPIIKDILKHQKDMLGSEHDKTVETITWLTWMYAGQVARARRPDLDAEWLKREIEVVRASLSDKFRRNIIQSLFGMAKRYFQQGLPSVAWIYCMEEMKLQSAYEGLNPVNIDTVRTRFEQAKQFEEARHHLGETLRIQIEYTPTEDSISISPLRLPRFETNKVSWDDDTDILNKVSWINDDADFQEFGCGISDQEEELVKVEALVREGKQHLEQGLYGSAEDCWKSVLEHQKRLLKPQHPDFEETLFHLADASFHLDEYSTAVTLWSQVVDLRNARLGKRHQDTCRALFLKGLAEFEGGEIGKAEICWRELHEVVEDSKIPLDSCLAKHWLGRALYEQEKFKEAEEIWESEMQIRRDNYDARTPEIQIAARWLGEACFKQGHLSDAERWWELEVNGLKTSEEDTGMELPEVLCRLGRACSDQGKLEEAERWWKEQVRNLEDLHGDNPHKSALDTMTCLGDMAFQQERHEVAIYWWKQEVDGRIRMFGPANAETVEALFSLGRAYFESRQFAEAEMQWKRAVRARPDEEGVGGNSSSTRILYWLGRVCFEQGRYEDAYKYWNQELKLKEATHERGSRAVLHVMSRVARACYEQGWRENAIEMWKEEVDLRQECHGEAGGESLSVMESISNGYCELGQYVEATQWCEKTMRAREDTYGSDAVELLNNLHLMGYIHFKEGRIEDAERIWDDELKKREEVHPEHHYVARVLYTRSKLYLQTNRASKAENDIQRALTIQSKHTGAKDPTLHECQELLRSINAGLVDDTDRRRTSVHEEESTQTRGYLDDMPTVHEPADNEIYPPSAHASTPSLPAAPTNRTLNPSPARLPTPNPSQEFRMPKLGANHESVRPFHVRPLFGRCPNHWCMFL